MYEHVLEIFNWFAEVEVYIYMHMYRDPVWDWDMVLLMCIFH